MPIRYLFLESGGLLWNSGSLQGSGSFIRLDTLDFGTIETDDRLFRGVKDLWLAVKHVNLTPENGENEKRHLELHPVGKSKPARKCL